MKYIKLFETYISTPHGLGNLIRLSKEALEHYYDAELRDLEVYQDEDGLKYYIHDKKNGRVFVAEWDPHSDMVDRFDEYPAEEASDFETIVAGAKKAEVWSKIHGYLENIKDIVHEAH